jgi:hypothetical protein
MYQELLKNNRAHLLQQTVAVHPDAANESDISKQSQQI